MSRHDIAVRGPVWSAAEIPSSLLHAELKRRQDEGEKPECGSNSHGSYNMPLHVFALVLILVLSTVACAFPLISRRTSKHKGPNNIIFLSQHFGTGVLIATAFVHLLPTAFVSLTDPCLPYFFSQGYRPTAGLIAMTSALIVVGIEMFLTTRGAGHSHNHSWEEEESSGHNSPALKNSREPYAKNGRNKSKKSSKTKPPAIFLHDAGSSDNLVNGASPLMEFTPRTPKTLHPRDSDSEDGNDSDLDLDDLDPSNDPFLPENHTSQPPDIETNINTQTPNQEEQKRLLLQCMMLEAGILFHSVFIGMAISVSTGTAFIIFLIAIAFHQSFEGLALGSRIAAISFPASSPKPWLMVLAYGTTTPIGQAIGLVVRRFYDPQSQTGLLMVGIMNAISSGLLIFAGLVQLLSEDFLSKKSYEVLKGRRRVKAFAAVIAGAILMALVGAWA